MYARRSALAVFGLGVVGMLALLVVAQTQPAETPPVIPTPGFSQVPAEPVARIVDGDTIVVVRGGQEVKVRLIGVNTPETKDPSKPVEPYSPEASQFTRNLLLGERVYVFGDPTQTETTDRYGRLLGFVYRAPDGLFVNAEIVRQGYGHAYTAYPFRYLDEFRQLERFAHAAGKGLWGASETTAAPTPPPTKPPAPPLAVTKPRPEPQPQPVNEIHNDNRKDQEEAISAMDERIRKAYRADPDRPILSALRFEDRKVTRIGKGSYEMVVVCSIVYPDRPTQRDRTRWHIRATHGPNGWQAELASLPEEP